VRGEEALLLNLDPDLTLMADGRYGAIWDCNASQDRHEGRHIEQRYDTDHSILGRCCNG